MALAAVSQMGENSADSSPAETITALVADMADGNIDGRVDWYKIFRLLVFLLHSKKK
jgi:hypothetical protein